MKRLPSPWLPRLLPGVVGLLLAHCFAPAIQAAELRVGAAASLAESIAEVAAAYQKKHSVRVRPVIAGSNVLARQIAEGAPIDVFIAADERILQSLVAKGHAARSVNLLTNHLVVVVDKQSTLKISSAHDLTVLKRLAVGDPAAVPAGVYAKRWLESRGAWKKMAGKWVGTENVRGALAAVEAGNAEAAVIYRTDAAISKKVKIALTVPEDESPEIRYPVAICSRTRQQAEAEQFVRFLLNEEAAGIFRKHGFGLIAREP